MTGITKLHAVSSDYVSKSESLLHLTGASHVILSGSIVRHFASADDVMKSEANSFTPPRSCFHSCNDTYNPPRKGPMLQKTRVPVQTSRIKPQPATLRPISSGRSKQFQGSALHCTPHPALSFAPYSYTQLPIHRQVRFKSKMQEATNKPLSGLYKPFQLQQLHYGPKSVEKHLLDCLPTSESKAFVITGSSLANKTPLVKDVEKLLGSRHAGTFSNIKQHAPVADLDVATDQVLKDSSIDTIISIGGGSPIDSAKAISYRVNERFSKENNGQTKFLHHIAVPTTLSAAECTPMAGFTNSSGQKTGVRDPKLAPQCVIYDATFIPNYTPPHLFLSTGMRAMDHALETLYHPTATELAKGITITAAADLFTYLPKYKADPNDHDIITKLQLAAYASLGFMGLNMGTSGLGLSHGLGYALGSPYGIPHGYTSCLTLGKVVQLKAQSGGDAASQIARATSAAGVQRSGDDVKDAVEVGKAVEKLVDDLGLKTKLDDWKVGKDQDKVVVKTATKQEEGPVFDAVLKLVQSLW